MHPSDFLRFANNFYTSRGQAPDIQRVATDIDLVNYLAAQKELPKYRVAFVFICLNPLYWPYAYDMVAGARQFFLPGHSTDFFFWTDIPENIYEVAIKLDLNYKAKGKILTPEETDILANSIATLRQDKNIHLIPTDAVEWPYPTLLRYNLFLQEEHRLKEYDYIFYCDIDMKFVSVVGDEILGSITAAQHPMYALRKEYWPPYEPNEQSASHIKRPGRLIDENGKSRFQPLYYAGGFQGGKSQNFIDAMKGTRAIIEKDMNRGYIPIWNDETAWNKYLSENPPEVVLSPSYIYPDSLIKEYYEPLWGCSYEPRLVTLTKWFTTSKEGGEAVAKMIQK